MFKKIPIILHCNQKTEPNFESFEFGFKSFVKFCMFLMNIKIVFHYFTFEFFEISHNFIDHFQIL
jgi:hypothetical protein